MFSREIFAAISHVNQSGQSWQVPSLCSVDKISSAMWTVWLRQTRWALQHEMGRSVVFYLYWLNYCGLTEASGQHATVCVFWPWIIEEFVEADWLVFAAVSFFFKFIYLKDCCLHSSSFCSWYLSLQCDVLAEETSHCPCLKFWGSSDIGSTSVLLIFNHKCWLWTF